MTKGRLTLQLAHGPLGSDRNVRRKKYVDNNPNAAAESRAFKPSKPKLLLDTDAPYAAKALPSHTEYNVLNKTDPAKSKQHAALENTPRKYISQSPHLLILDTFLISLYPFPIPILIFIPIPSLRHHNNHLPITPPPNRIIILLMH